MPAAMLKILLAATAGYQDAKIVLFGAPFDSTTSFRPGAQVRTGSYAA